MTTEVGPYRYIVMTYVDMLDKNKTCKESSFQFRENAMLFAKSQTECGYHADVFDTLAFSVVNN